jgi:predicted DNA-binding protein (MmcQ/YjbR family)
MLSVNPENAIELREKYSCVLPGYHMSKQHWNTIVCDGTVSDKQLKDWIDDSYNLIVSSLTKKLKAELEKFIILVARLIEATRL